MIIHAHRGGLECFESSTRQKCSRMDKREQLFHAADYFILMCVTSIRQIEAVLGYGDPQVH